MAVDESQRAEPRREGAPAAGLVVVVLVLLALVSRTQGWELVGLHWWIWLLLCVPALLLTIDLLRARGRSAALVLLGLLVAGNFVALGILVGSLVTASMDELTGGELLLTGFAVYTVNVAVFGLIFWEVEAGGPAERRVADERVARDFRFPQDDDPSRPWKPQLWDYFYVSLTNSIAFSPTDTMPFSLRAKALMGLESIIAAVTVLLVAARAVNVLGS
jgi:energy-coupling factor transporter transmembrane protein EcfT